MPFILVALTLAIRSSSVALTSAYRQRVPIRETQSSGCRHECEMKRVAVSALCESAKSAAEPWFDAQKAEAAASRSSSNHSDVTLEAGTARIMREVTISGSGQVLMKDCNSSKTRFCSASNEPPSSHGVAHASSMLGALSTGQGELPLSEHEPGAIGARRATPTASAVTAAPPLPVSAECHAAPAELARCSRSSSLMKEACSAVGVRTPAWKQRRTHSSKGASSGAIFFAHTRQDAL
eukprot:scaffold321018_cov28-Tisochrysis_lutea.AAC.2